MINLHVHTKYSWDSLSEIKSIVQFVKNNNQPSVAITDHGTIGGLMEFYIECKKHGIKPILGCEFYICMDEKDATIKNSENKKLNHLVVLAKNYTGYKNLLKLTKIANNNFYYDPRIDEKTLFDHKDGLIVINGHVNTSIYDTLFFNYDAVHSCDSIDCARQYLYPDYEDRFLSVASRYKNVFGDDFYIEVQLFDTDDIVQQSSGLFLQELGNKYGIKCVGTGDCHYITAEDSIYHKTFCAIKQNKKVKDLPNIRYYTSGKYGIITNEWAEKCYPIELLDTVYEINNKVENYDITLPAAIPSFNINNPRQYLKEYCDKQLKIRGLYTEEYISRLDYELETLSLGNLFDYFLIVEDYCKFAQNNNILMGPSRGSAGGCLLSFLLDIISINPIHYGLSFDRFFSKDKALSGTLPDIDSDFQASRRKEVINYIKHKYGEDKVAGVVSYSTLQGKNALKDVLRVHSACDFSQMNKITELIPARDKISDQLAEFKEETGSDSILFYCLKNEPDLLKDYCTLQEVNGVNIFSGDYGDYFKIAIGIESAIKSSSRHPSAIVISKYPIVDVAPLVRDKSSDELIIDYDMDYFPYASLVKFDILGIKSLDCLDEVNKLLIEIGIL